MTTPNPDIHTLLYVIARCQAFSRDVMKSAILILEVPDMKTFLTVKEAATFLRVRPETIRRWIAEGKIPGVMLGGTRAGYRIPSHELDKIIVREKPSE